MAVYHSKKIDLTNIWLYRFHDVLHVRTKSHFFKEIKTISFDKQKFHRAIVNLKLYYVYFQFVSCNFYNQILVKLTKQFLLYTI